MEVQAKLIKTVKGKRLTKFDLKKNNALRGSVPPESVEYYE